MNRVFQVSILVGVVSSAGPTSWTALHADAAAPPPVRHFRYVDTESTGQCEFVLSRRTGVPIHIDGSQAPRAFKAFRALDASVFVPNERGNIVVVGYLDMHPIHNKTWDQGPQYPDEPGTVHYRLVMKDWYLAAPFLRQTGKDEEGFDSAPPANASTLVLRRSDFATPNAWHNGFDWRSSAFNPAHHVRRLRLTSLRFEDIRLTYKAVPERILRSAGWIR